MPSHHQRHLLTIPPLVPRGRYCSGRFGRKVTLTVILSVIGSLFLLAFFLTPAMGLTLLYFLAFFLGMCLTVPYVIPDAMLGDIIDYDELLNGDRNEAMFSMVETNMQVRHLATARNSSSYLVTSPLLM